MFDPAEPDYVSTPGAPQPGRIDYRREDDAAPVEVSVVTPFLDTAPELFAQTRVSLLAQSFQAFEWLIVDDGSRDPAALAALAGLEEDDRVRVVRHERNRGLSAARNTGFRAARGRYVVQLDSDDLLEPTAIEKWLWCLESFPCFAFCRGFTVMFGDTERAWTRGFHDGDAFLARNQVDPVCMLSRSAHERVGGYDESNRDGLEDWEFWLRCADAGLWGATVPEFLIWYRRREVHGERWANWDESVAQRSFRARLRERYPGLWQRGFPTFDVAAEQASGDVPTIAPGVNVLRKQQPVAVLWCESGDPESGLDATIESLASRGYRIAVLLDEPTDHRRIRALTGQSSDLFVLPHFLSWGARPGFLRYFVSSRQPDVVVVPDAASAPPMFLEEAAEAAGVPVRFGSGAIARPGSSSAASVVVEESPPTSWSRVLASRADASLRRKLYRFLVLCLDPLHRFALRRGWDRHERWLESFTGFLLRSRT